MTLLPTRSKDEVRRRRSLIGGTLIVLLLGGILSCSESERAVTHSSFAPASLQASVDCSSPFEWRPDYLKNSTPAADLKFMGSVPTGFKPVYAVNCGFGKALGDSSSPVYLTGDFTALLAALAVDSDQQAARSCTDEYVSTLNLWLVNAQGQAIHVMEPIDVCSRPKAGVRAALSDLTSSPTPPAGN